MAQFSVLKSCLTSLLCSSMVFTSVPLPAQAPNSPPDKSRSIPRQPYKSTQLSPDDRILHALNRFTFGAKPGDIDAVKTMGLGSAGSSSSFIPKPSIKQI